MRDLFILGTNVHGLETVEIIERINAVKPTWNLVGFLVTEKEKVGQKFNDVPVVGIIDKLKQFPDAYCIPSYGFDVSLVSKKQMTNIIDPSTFVSRTAKIGTGCVIYPNCFVGLNAQIGDFLFCLSGSVINHDDIVEDNVCICTNVSLAGELHIEKGVYLGQACTVKQGLRIGCNSTIGMGAVVVKNVEADSVMIGNPAKLLRKK